jgi:hypothetical protein
MPHSVPPGGPRRRFNGVSRRKPEPRLASIPIRPPSLRRPRGPRGPRGRRRGEALFCHLQLPTRRPQPVPELWTKKNMLTAPDSAEINTSPEQLPSLLPHE